MTMALWPWIALAGLGAFHGLNPAMGWLFAVALGLQRQRREAVLQSLLPIALGHALSIGVVVLVISGLRIIVDVRSLEAGAALVLVGFGIFRLAARHRGRVGMQVSRSQLVAWSFLMATAHGAGLMLLPVLLAMPSGAAYGRYAHAHMAGVGVVGAALGTALVAVAVHTLALLCVAGVVGIAVYEWVGLAFLRRGWINLDLIWGVALLLAGAILLGMALA